MKIPKFNSYEEAYQWIENQLYLQIAGSGSRGNLAAIAGVGTNLIFDAGLSPDNLKIDWTRPTVLLLSHFHNDHAKYLDDFKKLGCEIIEPSKAIGNILELYGLKITGVQGVHDVEVAIYLINFYSKFILYATDTAKLPHVPYWLDLAIVEANWTDTLFERDLPPSVIDRIANTHLSVDIALEWFKKYLPKVGVLWHSSSEANLKPVLEKLNNLPVGKYFSAETNKNIKF